MDFKGSLLPADRDEAYDVVKALLGVELGEIFRDPASNFLAPRPLTGLRLRKGGNNLDSCLQYDVLDANGLKILQVKIYDKIMDLVGRDGTKIVGSKIAYILGCQKEKNRF